MVETLPEHPCGLHAGVRSRYDDPVMSAGVLQLDRLQAARRTTRVGRRIDYVESTTSTNDEAWQRINDEHADGLVIFTEYQTAGRGRLGREWQSPRGASLLVSLVLVEEEGDPSGDQLVLLTSVAAVDTIAACTDVVATIKWPNDLYASGRKLGGILIESRIRHDGRRASVIGIGLNCLHHRGHLAGDLAETATSLELESSCAIDRTAVAAALLEKLDAWLAEPGTWSTAELVHAWLARAEPMGHRVSLRYRGEVFSGTMMDLDPSAALVLRLDDGSVRAFDAAGTTTVERPFTETDDPGRARSA